MLLALFLSEKPLPHLEPIAKGGIEVVFEPTLPKQEAAPAPPETPPQPEPERVPPPPPDPPVVAAEPPPPEPPPPEPPPPEPPPPQPEAPVAASEPPPPPQTHVVKKVPKPVPRHQEAPQPTQAYAPTPPPQLSAAPAPVPSPEASAGYRALLSAWLESHKRYPDAARQRGEEGRAVLRFSVDRSGRVIDFAVTSSSGYPDLDQSVEEMMRGATLPPFPAGMPQREMQISVTIRFSLRR
jgi:protein TonB